MSVLLEEVRVRRQFPSRAVARAIREEAGVSQRRLAEELGVHPVTVARWELGQRRPRGPVLTAYIELLRQLQGQSS
jgi:DNA-binding transcriptional regulator YiaG